MKLGRVELVALAAGAAVVLYSVWRVRQGVGNAFEALASLPGAALDAVTEAAGAVVNGTSPISDPDGGGFVKEAAPARIVDYSKNRNIDPLIQFFIQNGNTDAARAAAYRAGWSADEVSLAVLAMAQHFGSI